MKSLLLACAFVALTGCPRPVTGPDGGDDSGINIDPVDECSGGCAINQVCNTQRRICEDGCGGTCGIDGGANICQRQPDKTFRCVSVAVTCNGATCEPGEVACIGGGCACLGPARGTFDSCFGDVRKPGEGKVCQGGKCQAPSRYQQCKTDGEPCPVGTVCLPVFGDNLAVCVKPCAQPTECDRGELCFGGGQCLPSGLGVECSIQVDGGIGDAGVPVLVEQTVGVGSTCLQTDSSGTFTEVEPHGTCTYAFFYFADQGPYAFSTCRPQGAVAENGECVQDPAITARATQCATGLECAGMRGGNKGVCMRTCNALPPSVAYPNPYPACGSTEQCVNLYRREDVARDGALLGVCAKKCNIFDPAQATCAPYGGVPAVCVPTNPDGRVVVSTDGSGLCLPQRETIAQLDAACAENDPFKGASCGSGQVCPPSQPLVSSVCTQVCDTTCTGASPPSRCATQVNSTCSGGKTCTRVTTTTGARLGFCL